MAVAALVGAVALGSAPIAAAAEDQHSTNRGWDSGNRGWDSSGGQGSSQSRVAGSGSDSGD